MGSCRERHRRVAGMSSRQERHHRDRTFVQSLAIRISRTAHATLRRLAEEADEPMTEVLEQAVEAYRRQRFLEALNEDFAALRGDETAWAAEQDERAG